jgi:hypothetical protein
VEQNPSVNLISLELELDSLNSLVNDQVIFLNLISQGLRTVSALDLKMKILNLLRNYRNIIGSNLLK